MSDFMSNGSNVLPGVKSDARAASIPVGASEWAGSDANQLRQALLDLRSGLLGTNTGFANPSVASVLATGSSTSRTLGDRFADVVNVKDFGAVGDGSTDDTVAVQAAITYALSFSRAKSLLVSGRCRITASLYIDRLVDNTLSEFRIIGEGIAGGFYVNSAINIFSVSPAFEAAHPSTVGPQSEFVTFEGIQFEVSSNALAAYVMDGNKFLRLKFINCNFRQIKVANVTTYSQTWHFTSCNIRNWAGTFFATTGSYDVSFEGNIAEFGEALFSSIDPAGVHHTYGFRAINNIVESLTKTAFKFKGARGVAIVGNYLELVGSGTTYFPLDFYTGGLIHLGVHIAGNFAVVPGGWFCQTGNGSFSTAGNYSSEGLWANTAGGGYVSSVDDHAAVTQWQTVPSSGFQVRGVDGVLRVGSDGIDTLVAQTLALGSNTTNKINLGKVGVATHIIGRFQTSDDAQASQNSTIYQGYALPNNANGNDGDIYFRADTPQSCSQRIYMRSGGIWVPQAALVSADHGDNSATISIANSQKIHRWATALTGNKTVTLSTTGATNGDSFRIVRTGLGAFSLDVGGLKTIPNSTAAFVDVAYDGSAWVLTGYGTL